MANRIHCPALTSLSGVAVVAICDRHPDKLQSTATRFQIERTYADYKTMIEDVAPDAVFAIGQPHTMYDTWAWCLGEGLNLFIEKPLGLTLHQARSLAYLAESNGSITQVCFQRRASPLLRTLVAQCEARGAVVYSSVEFIKDTPGHLTSARDHMYDDGIHAIDTLRSICSGEVASVHSVTRRLGVHDINLIATLLEFDSGAIGYLYCNWTSGYRSFRVGVHGPSVCAHADLDGRGYLHNDGELEGEVYDARQVAGSTDLFVYGGFSGTIREFLHCVRSGGQPSTNFSDALKTHIVAEKILALDVLRR